MWIEPSRNKYRACAYYIDPLTGSRHRVGVTIEKNTPQQRNKAKQKLDDIIARKLSCAPDVMRLSTLIDLYARDQAATLKASTCERNKRTCDTFLKLLGDCDVNKLSAGIVKRKFMDYTDNPTTINEYITRFKAMMRWAYRNDFVENLSFIDKLTRLKDKTKREKVINKFLEADECPILLESMQQQTWHDMTELMLLSGLRVGEVLALNEEDLDFTNREIIVNKTYDKTNMIVTTTKTLASTRRVYMQDTLVSFSRSLINSNKRNRALLYLDEAPLFFAPDGRRASYDAYRKYLAEVSERVLGRRIVPHTLRHTHASLLAEQGVPLEQITRRLGHEDSKITREIYIHITEKRKKMENEQIRKIALF